MTDRNRYPGRMVILDAHTLEEVVIQEDAELEAELHQLIEDHRDLLEFLHADNGGSWESVGQLLGYMVAEAESSPGRDDPADA